MTLSDKFEWLSDGLVYIRLTNPQKGLWLAKTQNQ